MPTSTKQKRDIARTIGGLALAGAVAASLIFLGNRNDAISEAEHLKAGVLTAHQIRAAFQNVSGRLVERPIMEGRTVEAGDLLLGIDGTDLRLSIASTEAAIRQLSAQIDLERASIELAFNETATTEHQLWRQIEEAEASRKAAAAALETASSAWKRAERLRPQGAIAEAAWEQARSGWVSAREGLAISEKTLASLTIGATKAQLTKLRSSGSAEGMTLETITNARQATENRKLGLAAQEAGREQLQTSLKQLRVNESRLEIHAPERAKVLEILFEPGELINPSTPAVLLETERRYVDIYVSEAQAAQIKPGDTMKCFAPALKLDVEGRISLVEAAPDFANLRQVRERGQADLTLFKVRVEIGSVEGLLPGMTLEARL